MISKSVCRRKYVRILVTMVMALAITGFFIPGGSESLTWFYPGVTLSKVQSAKWSIPSKLKLLSVTNHSEVHSTSNQSSFNSSRGDVTQESKQQTTSKFSRSPTISSNPQPQIQSQSKVLIPHIIHQTWDSDFVPSYFSNWIKSWTRLHPNWEYWFWTPKEVRRLIQIVNPRFLKEYNGYKLNLYRANSMRYYIMYYFGGVYADLDLEALKPLDNWTHWQHCILPEETYAHPFLLNKLRRANTMITLLACRPHHPYYKLAMNELSIYPKLKASQKLLYVDDIYMKYNRSDIAHARPENEIYLAHPKYFLPTFDPGWTSKFKGMCSSTYHTSKMYKQQREACDDLKATHFKNQPRPESYTNHHWTHVVIKTETWKQKNTVKIADIVPSAKDVSKELDKLEKEMKDLLDDQRKQKDSTTTKVKDF